MLLLLAAVLRAFGPQPADEPDNTALVQHGLLIAALTALSQLHVAGFGA